MTDETRRVDYVSFFIYMFYFNQILSQILF